MPRHITPLLVIRLTALLCALGLTPAQAHKGHDHPEDPNAYTLESTAPSASSASASNEKMNSAPMATGEVRKVDRSNATITLKHGEIKNLNMPPMTMVYKIKPLVSATLDKLKAGDKVKFTADKINGEYTITHIEVTP